MTFLLFIKQAISSIWANKLRSFLSTLGIMIGISSFVIMLAIGEGAKESMLKSMGEAGNIINIHKGAPGQGSASEGKSIFTEEGAKEIREKVPGVSHVVVQYRAPNGRVSYNGKNLGTSVQPISQDYLSYKKAEILYGSYFDTSSFLSGKKIAIIGNGLIKQNKWGGPVSPMVGQIPIGKTITIAGESFIIVGILKEKSSFDNKIFIPVPAYKKIFNDTSVNSFEVSVQNEEIVELTQAYLKHFLSKKMGIKPGKNPPFSVQANKEMLKQFNEMSQKFTLLLGGIGGIALIVGGIGIMNIMVVSVTERTREIGIRKAIGATNKNILLQFLIESVILTLLGSAIAVLFSQGIVSLLSGLMPDFKPVISSYVLMIAIIVSVSMGIIFGLMPAYKAAKLKIIDALHFE